MALGVGPASLFNQLKVAEWSGVPTTPRAATVRWLGDKFERASECWTAYVLFILNEAASISSKNNYNDSWK